PDWRPRRRHGDGPQAGPAGVPDAQVRRGVREAVDGGVRAEGPQSVGAITASSGRRTGLPTRAADAVRRRRADTIQLGVTGYRRPRPGGWPATVATRVTATLRKQPAGRGEASPGRYSTTENHRPLTTGLGSVHGDAVGSVTVRLTPFPREACDDQHHLGHRPRQVQQRDVLV